MTRENKSGVASRLHSQYHEEDAADYDDDDDDSQRDTVDSAWHENKAEYDTDDDLVSATEHCFGSSMDSNYEDSDY